MESRDNWLVRDKLGRCFISDTRREYWKGEFTFSTASLFTESEAKQVAKKNPDAVHLQHVG